MITTTQILDNVQASLTDGSANMRGKCLVWLNQGMQAIAVMRPWSHLNGSVVLASTLGVFTHPTDFGQLLSIVYDSKCLYPNDQMSTEAFANEEYQKSDRWMNEANGFSVWPEQASVTLNYRKAVPVYADGDTTLFPMEMLDVLSRYTLMRAYEYDMDERSTGSLMMYQMALKEAKKWDNSLKPLPKRTNNITWDNV